MYCWPRLLVKIDPKRSFFTFGPPPSGQKYVEGCLWASPGLLLGCSWLRLGCSWLLLGCSWAAPGCSWPAPGGSQAAPGLLPAALGLLLGFSWLLLGGSWLLLAAFGCSWAAPSWLLLGLLVPLCGQKPIALPSWGWCRVFPSRFGGARPRRNRIPKSMSNLAPKKIRQFWLQRWGFRVITGDPVWRCLSHTLWYF